MNIQNVKRRTEEEQKVKDVEDKLNGERTQKEIRELVNSFLRNHYLNKEWVANSTGRVAGS